MRERRGSDGGAQDYGWRGERAGSISETAPSSAFGRAAAKGDQCAWSLCEVADTGVAAATPTSSVSGDATASAACAAYAASGACVPGGLRLKRCRSPQADEKGSQPE